jgi:ethanolamine utilization protein EutQ (cupin superfamily)
LWASFEDRPAIEQNPGGRTDVLVAEVVRRVSEQEPVRIPREVLEELESVRRYTRVEVLDISTIRHVAMERGKPALVAWIDKHEQQYGQGLLNGFQAED